MKSIKQLLQNYILITTLIVLGGCFVDGSGDPKIFTPETNNLRVYKSDDFIEYIVGGTRTLGGITSTINGTLRIEWRSHAPLVDPVSKDLIQVLEEYTKLTVGNETTETVRYISQDPDDGTMYVHALDKDLTDFYWLDLGSTIKPSVLDKIKLIQSPFAFNYSQNVDYYIFDGCNDTDQCNVLLGSHKEIQSVGNGLVRVSTNRGLFDTFPVRYEAGHKDYLLNTGSSSFPIQIDIRSSCALGNTTGGTQFEGTSYYYPPIGVMYQESVCNSLDGTVAGFTYFIEFSRAGGSIPVP